MDFSLLFPSGLFPVANLFTAYADSSFVGKLIVDIQIVMSIVLWTIMITKFRDFRNLIKASGEFRRFFSSTDSVLGFHFSNPRSRNPLIVVYAEATARIVRELNEHGDHVSGVADAKGRTLSAASMAIVKGVAEETLATQSLEVEKGMGGLASCATIAPLLGLLGTVWGVLEAFEDMGAQGSVNLATIAPSLSTAMLTTVVGLLVAIPSGGFYNFLLGYVRRINITLDGFTDEYLGRVLSEFGERR